MTLYVSCHACATCGSKAPNPGRRYNLFKKDSVMPALPFQRKLLYCKNIFKRNLFKL